MENTIARPLYHDNGHQGSYITERMVGCVSMMVLSLFGRVCVVSVYGGPLEDN